MEDQGPNQTESGYRKHPFHKPSWGPYPVISITTSSNVIGGPVDPRKNDTKSDDDEVVDGGPKAKNVLTKKRAAVSKYYRVKQFSLPWIIKQIAKFSVIWEIVMYVVIVSSMCLTSFSTFYAFFEQQLWFWIGVFDLLFAADTIMRLGVEVWRYQSRATVVVFTAPYTILQFFLDVMSMLPLHQLYYWIEGSSELKDLSMIDYYRLNRFIRFSRCVTFFSVLEKRRMVNEKLLFLFTFSNYYLGFIYFTGCLLVSRIGVEPLDYLLFRNLSNLEKSYLKDFQTNKAGYGSTPWDIFVITTNFATAVITTVGYGDVTPKHEKEMVICIVCMLVGAIFLNGYFTSEMTNFELELDGAQFDLYYRLMEIRKFLGNIKSLSFFTQRVVEYYNCLWTYREGVFDVPFMRALPESFHEELLFDICQEMFDKSHLFRNLDPAFLRSVSNVVTVALYNPNMLLCRTGGYANRLYYILQGECQAMSKLNPANPAAVLRAGSIIGEANLMFSYPYSATVETRTCCQFIILKKQDLLEVVDKFSAELAILRTRSLTKMEELYETHQAFGVDPVCWVKAKPENPSNPHSKSLDNQKLIMREGAGFNKKVLDEDVVDDSEETVIFHTPCPNEAMKKNHLIPYMSCAVPEILHSEVPMFIVWNYFMIGISLWYAFVAPYCVVYSEATNLEHYVCRTQYLLSRVISLIFIADVLVEILGACPVADWYYKFWDGLSVVRHQPTFYLDVLAALPLDVFTAEDQNFFHILGTTFKVFKLWKVIRFLKFVTNAYPLQLFWVRLAQTITVLMYGVHFTACILYYIACPYNAEKKRIVCEEHSWLSCYELTYKITNPGKLEAPYFMRGNTLGYDNPYLYSFFYSAVTLTSAGFGDFNPQNRTEMLWDIGFQLFGFFLTGYYTSVLTSSLSCLMRPRLALQQQLVSLYQFMDHYHLREQIKDRIVEYFVLQHQLRGGVALDRGVHLLYDAPAYIRDDVLYLEVYELLDGVPVFSKVDSEVIIKLSSCMKRFLIPPNTTFVQKGEVRRTLYIVKQGSLGVSYRRMQVVLIGVILTLVGYNKPFLSVNIFEDGFEEPVSLLQSSAHFGVRDLLFGEPSHYTIRSLSYVTMYAVRRREFEEALQEDDQFWNLVNDEKERIRNVIHEMTLLYTSMERTDEDVDKATHIPSWVVIPRRVLAAEVAKDKTLAKINLLNDEYEAPFEGNKYMPFVKFFLLRKTVHPAGTFSKAWNVLMSLVCCLTVITLMLETFCALRMPGFRLFQMALDWINYIDIYLKLHWSYYNPNNGLLITHPLKTAVYYAMHGSLVLDIATCAPIELLMWMFGLTTFFGYGRGASWYSRLKWFRFFQVRRTPTVFKIVHNVFKNRSLILVTLYVTITVFACTMVSSVAQFIACPWESNNWKTGDEHRIPICIKTGWVCTKYTDADTDPQIMSSIVRRWIVGLYYVSQVILGLIFMKCIVSDMTAAEVDSDQARPNFARFSNEARESSEKTCNHLRYTWVRSRGLQPRELFGDLHPVLESELYRNLVGNKLESIPIFSGFPPTVLRSICRYMKTQYIRRGERLMRYGNLEYEMGIILAGKVNITDQYLNYVCHLTPGQSYGESSLIYGMARRFNAIAATNVEVFTISATRFKTFLGRYPNFRNDMKHNLNSERMDYFEKQMQEKTQRAVWLNHDKKRKMLKAFAHRSAVVRDLIAHKEDLALSGLNLKETQLKKRGKFFGAGDLDDNLPLIYFCNVPTKARCRSRFVIHPHSKLVKLFTTVVTWLCFISPAIAAYEVCFSREFLSHNEKLGLQSDSFVISKRLHEYSEYIEFTFLFYMLLQFFLAFEVKPGVFNKTHHCIMMRYLTARDGFMYDLLGSTPFIYDLLYKDYGFLGYFMEVDAGAAAEIDPENKRLLDVLIHDYYYMLRCVRLYYYYKSLLAKKDDLDVSTFRLQITLSVSSFILMAHMLACLFYGISPCTRPDILNTTFKFDNLCPSPQEEEVAEANSWTSQYAFDREIISNIEGLEAWRWWFRSLYWVVTTISTTGFGDIVPTSAKEMVVGIICIFCGAFILSIILSRFTSGMASLTRTKREYMYQVLLLVKHLKNIGLSEIRQSQVMMYFLTLWERSRGIPYHKTWGKLPIPLQIELAYALFGKTLNKVPFFTDTSERIFLRQLSSRVTHSLYIPGTYIHKDGDPGSNLFVVYKGLVSGTIMMPGGEPDLKQIYNPGDAFGKFAAFFQQGTYKKSYRAETMVEVLEVKQKDLVHLAKHFPRFKRMLYNFMSAKYRMNGFKTSIFSRMRRRAVVFGVADELKFAKAVKKALRNMTKSASNFRSNARLREATEERATKVRKQRQKQIEETLAEYRGEPVQQPKREENRDQRQVKVEEKRKSTDEKKENEKRTSVNQGRAPSKRASEKKVVNNDKRNSVEKKAPQEEKRASVEKKRVSYDMDAGAGEEEASKHRHHHRHTHVHRRSSTGRDRQRDSVDSGNRRGSRDSGGDRRGSRDSGKQRRRSSYDDDYEQWPRRQSGGSDRRRSSDDRRGPRRSRDQDQWVVTPHWIP